MRADDFLDSNNSANDFLDGVEPKNEPVLKDQVYTALNKLFRSEESSVMDGYQGKGVYDPVARQKLNEEIKRLQQSQAIALPDGPRQVSGGVGIAEKAVRGGVGSLAKSGIGIAQLLADAFQANGASQFMQSAGRRATDFQNGVALDKPRIDGFAHNSIVQDLPNAAASAGSSIISSVPALLASIATANPSVGLGVMFGQSAGQEYGEGRTGGLGSLGALLRAVPMGAAEVIGEKVGGFGQLTHGLRSAVKGEAPERVLRQVGAASARDLPGEQLTTLAQFGVDKLPGIGTNQEAGLKEYLQQVKDTALTTMIQGGTMTGGAMAVNKAARRGMPVIENEVTPGAVGQSPHVAPQNMLAEAFLNDGAPVSTPDRTGEIKRLIEETANIASRNDVPVTPVTSIEQTERSQSEVAPVAQTPIDINADPVNQVTEQSSIQNVETVPQESTQDQVQQATQTFQAPAAIRENAMQTETPMPGLRPGDIVLATGIPFNNQSVARAAAKDAGKGWRVSPGGGGFVVRYQPATEKQIASSQRRARQQAVIDTDTDSMFAAIAKLGSISTKQIKSRWGIDPADIRGLYGAGIRRVATRKGLSLDEMGNRLAEYGYLSRDQHGRFDGRELEELFNNELGGVPHYTPEGFANSAQKQQDAEYAEYLSKQDATDTELSELSDQAQEFVHDVVLTDKTEDVAVDAFLNSLEIQNGGQQNIATGQAETDTGIVRPDPGRGALEGNQDGTGVTENQGGTDDAGRTTEGTVEDYEGDYYPQSRSNDSVTGIDPIQAEQAARDFMDRLPGAGTLQVSVVTDVSAIPESVKPSNMAEGVYYPASSGGRIYLVANNLQTMDRMHEVLAHEVIGHFGVESFLGDGFTAVLSDVRRIAHIPDGARITGREKPGDKYYATMESVALSYPDYSSVNRAREVLARMAEANDKPVFLQSLYNKIRAALRSMGLNLRVTNDDLRQMVIDAGKYLRSTPAQKAHSNMLQAAASMAASESGDDKSSKALPEAVVGHALGELRNHPDYEAAKSGNTDAAFNVAVDLVTDDVIARVNEKIGDQEAVILPVLAIEGQGNNKIPLMTAMRLGDKTGRTVDLDIYQSVKANRTALNGLDRIFRRPQFDGPVQPGANYFLVDDTLTQGGTFAALSQHIQRGKGNVAGAFTLTGKQYSANLALQPQTLQVLRERYGDIEQQFRAATGYGFDSLTESEGRYLTKHGSPDAIRERILNEGHASIGSQVSRTRGEAGQQLNNQQSKEESSESGKTSPLESRRSDDSQQDLNLDEPAQRAHSNMLQAAASMAASEKSQQEYGEQVDNLLSGKTSQAATLGNPSPLLLAAGIPDKPLRITRNVIEKIAGGKHHLTVDQVKDLPRLLASPVMVFKSATQDRSFVVVVDADAPTDRGTIEPIVVAIKPDGTVERQPANVVTSAHGRSGFAATIDNWVANGLLAAAQKKTASTWLTTRGLQLPRVVQAIRRSGTVNISPDSPAVNAQKITNERITTIAESRKQSSEDQQDLSLDEPLQLPKREPVRARDFVTTEKNAIGSREYVAGRKLYERTADLSRAILSKLPAQIMFADNQSHAFKKMMRQLQIDQNKAVENAKRIAESGQTITPAERVMLSDMIEKQLAVADVPPDHIAELAAGIQSTLKIQAEKLVELGMLSEDRLIENYLPRLYRNPLVARLFSPEMMRSWFAKARMKIGGARLQSRGLIDEVPLGKVDGYKKLGWKVSTLADGTEAPADLLDALNTGDSIPEAYRAPDFKVMMWRDYTQEEREKMGEVRDGVLRYALGYVETQKDIAIGRLFKAIASHSGLASAVNPGGWIKIPEDDVKGSPGVKQYGALAGMFVPRDVSDALKRNTQPKGLLIAAYDRALSFWKEGKTVWNPVAHGNNVVSNLFVMHFAGLNPANPVHYRDTIKEFKNRGQYWDEAVDHGLFGAEFANSELRNMLMPDLEDMADIETVAASRVAKMTDFLTKYPGRPISWYRTNMQKAYEFEDQFFKLMIFMDRRKKGMGIDDAIVDSERYIFNYADVPEGVQNLKRWYSPFFSYTYKVLPMLLHTAMTRPDRMLAPMMLLGGANWLAYAYLGADEDDEREGLPEWMAGNTALGVPKSLRMPFDVDGKPAFMDISRRVPGGDLFDAQNQTGGVPIAAPFMPSHPVFSLVAALFLNKDTFTGDDLIKKSDTPWEASGKRAGYVYRQLMPNAPLLPGSYSFDKLMNGAAYEFDTQFLGYTGRTGSGDPTPLGLAMADTLSGTRIRVTDPKRGIDYKIGDIQRDMREINANIRSTARDKSKTVGNRNAYIAGEREKQRRLMDRLRELRH